MSLASVRARLKDRQVKAGALGTVESTICLDVALIEQLEELERALALDTQLTEQVEGKPRAGGSRRPAAAKSNPKLEAEVEAKRREVRESSLRLVFRSLSSTAYQEIGNQYPDSDSRPDQWAAFLNHLSSECLYQVWEQEDGAEKQLNGLTWDEIREGCNSGEWDNATMQVLALNRRKVDIPFSLRSSKATPG